MKWLTNVIKPFDKETKEWLDNLQDWIEGKPKETDFHTSSELEEMGYVGIYKLEILYGE